MITDSAESFDDLTAAAQSSLDFWDNPLDDDDWNAEPKPIPIDPPVASADIPPG